jgi:prepilin-type N-terminal cleavage/methylation domain-containing protein
MSKRQSGFSLIELLLVLILVTAIGFTGYYVWHSQKQADQALKVNNDSYSATNAQSSRKVADESCTAGTMKGKYLPLKDGTFEFCEPNGWKLMYTEVPGAFFASTNGITHNESSEPTTEKVGGSDNNYEFFVFDKGVPADVAKGFDHQSTTKTGGGLALDTYSHLTTKSDPVGAGIDYLAEGTKQYLYVVTKGQNHLFFTYHAAPGQTDQSDMIAKVTATTR